MDGRTTKRGKRMAVNPPGPAIVDPERIRTPASRGESEFAEKGRQPNWPSLAAGRCGKEASCSVAADNRWAYTAGMDLLERVTIDPEVRGGKPCIRGTRITVGDILEYLAGGMSEAEILRDFPALSSLDVRAALAFAAVRERRLSESPAA